ncbi:MAG: hypothetical protein M3R24_42485 [Chloroflexota bacterium]|nr:hypothetical protein [Chloroflexota bacterium]
MTVPATWEPVGSVLVQSGLLIGDHVYFAPYRSLSRRLSEHLHARGAFERGVYAFNADAESAVGWPGKAVWIKSPDGAGMYAISVLYSERQQIEAVQIDLINAPLLPG